MWQAPWGTAGSRIEIESCSEGSGFTIDSLCDLGHLTYPLWASDFPFGLKPVFPRYVITPVLSEANWQPVKKKKSVYFCGQISLWATLLTGLFTAGLLRTFNLLMYIGAFHKSDLVSIWEMLC